MKMNLNSAIEILKLHKHTTDKFKHSVGDQYVSDAIDTVVASYEEKTITVELEKKTLLLFAAYMENEMGINIPMSIINNYLENN